jgi:hypothetical protein
LYILDAENGSIIKKFDTLVGNVSNPNPNFLVRMNVTYC